MVLFITYTIIYTGTLVGTLKSMDSTAAGL